MIKERFLKMTHSKFNFKKLSLIFIILISASIGIYYYKCANGIYAYDDSQKERDFITDIFKNNWDWLVYPGSSFSPDYMLTYKAPTQNLEDIGKLTINVYLESCKPKGFVAYYKEKFYAGRILFLAVPEQERRRGYAKKLLLHAIEDLKKRGCNLIRIFTRVANIKAQTLYKSVGFKETERDDFGMYLEKYVGS